MTEGGEPAEGDRPDASDGEAGDASEDEAGDGVDDGLDEIPLTIAGHEDRDHPGGSDGGPLAGSDHDPLGGSDDGPVDGDHGPVAGGEGVDGTGAEPAADDATEVADEVADDASRGEENEEADDEVDGAVDGEEDGDGGEVEPIELLVQLAKDGEIDPWDVDVVQVTEEFLAALDDGDLRQSGRALFYASVLVRMKSDVLLEPEEPPEAEDPWDGPMDAPGDAPPAFDPVQSLEAEMERRLDRKHVRGSPETLDELVRELREAERGSWWKESREYDTSGSPEGYARGTQTVDYHMDDGMRLDGEPTAREVTERTHAEDIEEVIDLVRAALAEHYEAGRPEVLFREVEDAGGSRVETFLAVLFLANRGEVRLQQDRLFGDLWLQDPAAELGAEGALAD